MKKLSRRLLTVLALAGLACAASAQSAKPLTLVVPFSPGCGSDTSARLLAGHVQISFATVLESIGHIRSGKLRALAVTSEQRIPALPDVPTVAETVAGFKSVSWVGVLAPAKTPKADIDRLAAAVRDAVAQPDVTRKLNEQGAVARTTTPAQFAALIQADHDTYARLIADQGITAE